MSMTDYAVLRVTARAEHTYDIEGARVEEVGRYIYGRHFFLGSQVSDLGRQYVDLFFLIEECYLRQVIDRLASGLFAAGEATPEMRKTLGL